MKWKGRQGSSNIEDRRGGRGGMSPGRVGGGLGLGAVVVIVIAILLGQDPLQFLEQLPQGMDYEQTQENSVSQPTDELGQFVSVVLKETERVWSRIFREQLRADYREPVLVLFDGSTGSACGYASAATGPFYCPADKKLYIDLSFYSDLKNRFGAPGDFAMAYVVAHEVAHHVQNLMGTTRELERMRSRISKTEYNKLSVRLELQADFYAGLWAHHAQQMEQILERGDIEEALRAANAIGDDRLQMESRGYVVPESFTHGTSEQRMHWFKKGFETGDIRQGDTFNVRAL